MRWAGLGFVVGLGFWVNPLIISAVLATTIWIVCDRVAEVVKQRRQMQHIPRRTSIAILHSANRLLLIVAAIPTCMVGLTPAIVWGATHNWANVTYLLQLGGSPANRLVTIRNVTRLYKNCVAPRIISGSLPLESTTLATLHSPVLIFGGVCILATTALVVVSFAWHQPLLVHIRQLAALPALFGASTAFAFCTNAGSASGLISCNDDFVGRYATPLLLALPFFFATVVAAVMIYLRNIGERQQQHNFQLSTVAFHLRLPKVVSGVLLAFLFVYLGAHIFTYELTNVDRTFQSPYCLDAPANNDPIIAYMQQQHIQYAWASNFLAYPLVFKTQESIIAVDPLPLMHPKIAVNRFPAYTDKLLHANRPSLLVFVAHDDPYPRLLRQLDREIVTYRAARFASEPGFDVLIVTPLSRTVSPFESKAFDLFYCI